MLDEILKRQINLKAKVLQGSVLDKICEEHQSRTLFENTGCGV